MILAKLNSIEAAIYHAGIETAAAIAKMNEALKAYSNMQQEALNAMELSKKDAEIEENYGPEAQPTVLCDMSEVAGAYQVALLNNMAIQRDMQALMRDRSGRHANRQAMHDDLWEKLQNRPSIAEIIDKLGLGKSTTTISIANAAEILEVLNNIYNAMPPLLIPDEAQETQAGQDYELARQNYLAKKEFYNMVINRYVTDRTATIDNLGDWAWNTWKQMGSQLDLPADFVEPETGMMSMDSLRYLLANYRIGSTDYFEGSLSNANEVELLRDIAAAQAVSIELERKELELIDSLAMMMAFEGLQSLQMEESPILNQLYQNVYQASN